MDFSKIVNDNNTASKQGTMQKETIIQSDNSVFVDDPDVPPLIWQDVTQLDCTMLMKSSLAAQS